MIRRRNRRSFPFGGVKQTGDIWTVGSLCEVVSSCQVWFGARDVNRVPVNRITGYVTRDRFQLTVTDTRKSKLRFATPSGRPGYKRGQEADNDQKRTPQSLQTAYVNKTTSSHRPMGAEHGRSFRSTLPMSHPLSDTGRCRPARLMSATAPAAAVRGSCQRKCPRRQCRRCPLIAAAMYNTMCLRINDATPGFRHYFIITTL